MAAQKPSPYEFADLPLSPVDPGTNLLVAGPTLGGTREVLLRLLLGGDGVVVVTADTGARQVLEAFEGLGGRRTDGVRVVDCTQEDTSGLGSGVATVGTPADLTGIGIEYSNHYEQVYARGYDAVRTGIHTLTPLLVYSDEVRPVFRFVNTVTSRVRTADGLGLCAIDPEAHDDRVVGSVTQPFDGRIEVREGETGPELRVQGLEDQPTTWTSADARA
ncbi:DUF7504 family protein [Haloarcula litorea]|uniref:DUF7504 family protein n=1 Tax=Haloarcula litorea TaxID=3032579 RepID=UPI0023E8E528|nr:hypothetical protein [Halomicroarcula sp. GDY20]